MENRQRVIIYVDGFNFYFGLKDKKWKKYYWLDFVSFFDSLLRPHQELVEVKYFSARPTNPDKSDRQDLLFSANKVNCLSLLVSSILSTNFMLQVIMFCKHNVFRA